MNKILKWALRIIGILILLNAILIFYFNSKSNSQASKVYDINVAAFDIPSDSVSIERGRILAVGCRNCHGNDYAGKAFFDDPTIGKLYSSNLTRAKGSTTENYNDLDWIRAIRHGLKPENKALTIMPSEAFCSYSDQDLGSLIAFLKTLPPKTNELGKSSFSLFASVLSGASLMGNLYPANIIDHPSAVNIPHISLSDSLAYGEYLSRIEGCKTCHGNNLGGGISPNPVSPPVPNITSGGNFGKWSVDAFTNIFRAGITPEGKVLDGKFMPFAGLGAFSDAEISSLYQYIRSLPAIESTKE